MNLQRTLLLATSLVLAACSGSGPTTQASTGDPSVPAEKLTVLVVEASGGGWGGAAMAREAMEELDGIDRLLMSGRRATLVLEEDAKLSEADVKKVLEDKKLTFESLEKVEVPRAGAAYVAKTPKFTWGNAAVKVREALLQDLPGVQDVFCGPETIVHLKHGATKLEFDAIEKALEAFEVACYSVKRDDSAVL